MIDDGLNRDWPVGGYAPGLYECECINCSTKFDGDKRAKQCLPCAALSLKAEIERLREAQEEPVAYMAPNSDLRHNCKAESADEWGKQFTPLFTAPPPPSVDADELSNFIRKIDGNHTMGAGQLAERICEWLSAANK